MLRYLPQDIPRGKNMPVKAVRQGLYRSRQAKKKAALKLLLLKRSLKKIPKALF